MDEHSLWQADAEPDLSRAQSCAGALSACGCPVSSTSAASVRRGIGGTRRRPTRSFIHHPKPGERLYRTGDLGRYLPDGNIEFLGRDDFQVKIQGYRVELEEISTVLGQHPAVRSSVVAALGQQFGGKRLVAYVVLTPDYPSTAVNELTVFLKERLPPYMVPTAFVTLDHLPLSSNGKVDRQALPEPAALDRAPVEKSSAKWTAQSAQIAGLIADILESDTLIRTKICLISAPPRSA